MAHHVSRVSFLVVALLVTAASLGAHHSPWAQFNMEDAVEFQGTVVKVEWTNPHIWFYVDVKGEAEDGQVETWGFVAAPPAMLRSRGISRDVLKVGEIVTVRGFRAKDGSNNAQSRGVAFADGREVVTAAPSAQVPR